MGMPPGMPLGAAPPQPEMQQAQQGLGPVADRNMPSGPPNPNGVLLASADAIRSVLEKMAGENPGFAPFARAAVAAITNGVSAVMNAPAPGLPSDLPTPPPPGGPGIPMG